MLRPHVINRNIACSIVQRCLYDKAIPMRRVNNKVGIHVRTAARTVAIVGAKRYVRVNAARTSRTRRRAAALRRMADKAGFTFTECGACRDDNWTSRLTSLADELAALPTPCGVMAYNDRCAREVIDACNLAGLSIPSQIQVVGVDDQQEICENVRPRLTSIEPDFEGVGYLLAQRMDELLTTGKAKKMSICGVKRIVERETTRDLSGAARPTPRDHCVARSSASEEIPKPFPVPERFRASPESWRKASVPCCQTSREARRRSSRLRSAGHQHEPSPSRPCQSFHVPLDKDRQ